MGNLFSAWVALLLLLIGLAISMLGAWASGAASESPSPVIQRTQTAATVLIALGVTLTIVAFVLKP